MTREVVRTKQSQVLLLAGSGTLGWDQVGANLVEKGDKALVLHTGYFGDGFAEWYVLQPSFFGLHKLMRFRRSLKTYGAQIDMIKASLGGTVKIADVERALKSQKYKLITITHVDTSTGVLSDAEAIAACVRRVSPDTLIILDAVCSLASEDVHMDSWRLDIILSASQKGLGAPPGLSILIASPRAISTWETRQARGVPSGSFYSSWGKWLPIMRAYDSGKPAYFGTPAVNLVRAYHASLAEITKGPVGFEERLALHKKASDKVKRAAERLGMAQVATDPNRRAHGMTAVYVPQHQGLTAADVLPLVGKRGVVMAGGLVAEIKDRYIRVGHMGWSVVGDEGRDIDYIVKALEEAVGEARAAVSARL